MIGNAIRNMSRVAVLALVAVGLAGCYDVETTLTFQQDGTAKITSRMDLPRDAEHVAKLYQAMLELQPGMNRFFDEGICKSFEKFASLSPYSQQYSLKAHEYTTEARFGCGFLYEAGDTGPLVDNLKLAPMYTGNLVKVREVSPGRLRIELDFNNMPDLGRLMPGMVMMGAMKYQKPGQPMPDMAAIDKLTKAYVEASLAMARMSAPNNHIQFAIKARKIIETNGEQEGDLVRFRWGWEEMTRLLLKPSDVAQQDKVFYALVEY